MCDKAQVVKSRLNRMSYEATNMATKLRAEELDSASDRHIACVISTDGRSMRTDEGICREFCYYFQKEARSKSGSVRQFG